jgi:hypothetical protein
MNRFFGGKDFSENSRVFLGPEQSSPGGCGPRVGASVRAGPWRGVADRSGARVTRGVRGGKMAVSSRPVRSNWRC